MLVIAILMGGVFLVIAYTYKLQKETEIKIISARLTVSEAKEMENELTALKGLTYTYIFNKSHIWLDSLKTHQAQFVIQLERARMRANSPEEVLMVQQISALFSNYEQNVLRAISYLGDNDINKANSLLLHSAQDLLGTIQQKSSDFIGINREAEDFYETELRRTNNIILKILIYLGVGGVIAGLLFGWLISRKLFIPINQLVLTIRGAPGEAVLEKLSLESGSELDEIGVRIRDLIERINRANEDLTRNKELLQHSNKYASLGMIAPTIAHEIRNPLAAIKMLVYSIGELENIPKSVKEDLRIISNEIDRMDNFTRDFLRFARPADPVFTELNPTVSLTEVTLLLTPRLKKGNIHLIYNPEPFKFNVLADAGQLKQVFMNIILNAIEVIPDGGTLRIDTINYGSEENGGRFCRIDFIDSGPGIPEAILNKIFEPFIKANDMGVGIGLSISQSIARSHGGRITAENSQETGGAIFRLYLPVINDSIKQVRENVQAADS
jgi:signal transduction histidine kinase